MMTEPGLKNLAGDAVEEKKEEPQRKEKTASGDLALITQGTQAMDRTGGHEVDQA